MTITQVLYVLEAASCKSISQAAERLYVSQSAISQQILKLEQELGYSLFARSPHGLVLTSSGIKFCREARPVIDAWQKLCKNVQAGNPSAKKQIRVGMGARVYSNGLFPDIVSFFDGHPELEVSFFTEAGLDFLQALRQQSIDLALDRLPTEDAFPQRSDYYICELIREQQCLLMSKDDPRAGLSELPFSALRGCTMISGLENSSEDRVLKDICRYYDIPLERIYRTDGITTSMDLVRNGKGVALGPRSFASYYNVAAVPMTPKAEISLQFICLRSALHKKEIRQFRDYLIPLCREQK